MNSPTWRPSLSEITSIFSSAFPLMRWPAKTALCQQGDPPNHVFLLEEGIVSLNITQGNGREIIAGTRTPLWIIGARSAVLDRPLPATVKTIGLCSGRAIISETFGRLLNDHPALSDFIHWMDSKELDEQDEKLSSLASFTARQRLEDFLWNLTAGKSSKNVIVRLPFSRTDLAYVIQTTPPYLSGLFHELAEERLVLSSKVGKGVLIIPNREHLWNKSAAPISRRLAASSGSKS
jgi:CRP-like cAMP-binding protein